jgi:hypothetical protein
VTGSNHLMEGFIKVSGRREDEGPLDEPATKFDKKAE